MLLKKIFTLINNNSKQNNSLKDSKLLPIVSPIHSYSCHLLCSFQCSKKADLYNVYSLKSTYPPPLKSFSPFCIKRKRAYGKVHSKQHKQYTNC